jgi:hypothetical protein
MVMLEDAQHAYSRRAELASLAATGSGPDRIADGLSEDPHLAAAVDSMLDRSGGWRLTRARPRRRGDPVLAADEPVALQALLDELDVELGFRLPPREQALLRQSPPQHLRELTDAIFAAVGLDASLFPHLRRQVRQRAARRLQ